MFNWLASVSTRLAGPPPLEALRTPNPRREPRLPFGALLEHGLLEPGQCLYFGPDSAITATVLADGKLESQGQRGSIHQIARLYKSGPCNGWTLWYYLDASTDQRQPIDHLRKQVQESFVLVGEEDL